MQNSLPATPLEALKISGALRFAVSCVHKSADAFGFWNYPCLKAAGDFERMTLMHKIYWGYKSKNPVIYPEKGRKWDSMVNKNITPPSLPGGITEQSTVSFSAVGDLIKVDGLENSQNTLYKKIAPYIFDKDISYANLESQMTGQDISGYTFSEKETPPLCCTKEQYDALKGYNQKQYTLMHTACNHTLDMGLEGLQTTLDYLEKDQIIDLGTNRTPEEQIQGRIIEKNGITIGFVSATFGLNGKEIPQGKEFMVNVVTFHQNDDLSLLEKQIKYCKRKKCDIIVASLHWGYEYEFFPRQAQVDAAHHIVEMGADIIVSHHAHVIQPIEYYRPKRNPDKTAVIAYSLGNLTSSFSAPHLVLSTIMNLNIVKGKVNGKVNTFIDDVRIIPVVQTENADSNSNGAGEGSSRSFQLELLEDLSKKKNDSKEMEEYIGAIERYAKLVLE